MVCAVCMRRYFILQQRNRLDENRFANGKVIRICMLQCKALLDVKLVVRFVQNLFWNPIKTVHNSTRFSITGEKSEDLVVPDESLKLDERFGGSKRRNPQNPIVTWDHQHSVGSIQDERIVNSMAVYATLKKYFLRQVHHRSSLLLVDPADEPSHDGAYYFER